MLAAGCNTLVTLYLQSPPSYLTSADLQHSGVNKVSQYFWEKADPPVNRMLYFTLILSRYRELHETNNGIRTIIFGIALSPNQDSTYFFHHSWLATDSHDSHRVTKEYRLLPKRCKVFFFYLSSNSSELDKFLIEK